MEDAIHTALLTLREGFEGEMNCDNIRLEHMYMKLEQLILQSATGEYLAQIAGGIPMSQGEMLRIAELGVDEDEVAKFMAVPAAFFSQCA